MLQKRTIKSVSMPYVQYSANHLELAEKEVMLMAEQLKPEPIMKFPSEASRSNIAQVVAQLGIIALQESLAQGNTIEIPALGVVIEAEKTAKIGE